MSCAPTTNEKPENPTHSASPFSAGRVAEHRVDAGDAGAGRRVRRGQPGPPADGALAAAEAITRRSAWARLRPVAHAHHPPVGLELGAVADDVAERVGGVAARRRTATTAR